MLYVNIICKDKRRGVKTLELALDTEKVKRERIKDKCMRNIDE